jgi:hypothetical protein
MRAKMRKPSADVALTRVLIAMEQELIDATDAEVMAAAKDLGMDPTLKESAAFAGLTYTARAQLSDFFDMEAFGRPRLTDTPDDD